MLDLGETFAKPQKEDIVMGLESYDNADQLGGELDLIAAQIEVCENAAMGLEALALSVEATKADGGLTESMSAIMAAGADGILSNFNTTFATPSQESFGEAGGRMAGTEISVESLNESAKRVWKKIKEFVAKWVKKAEEFIAQHIKGAGRLNKAAKSLSKKASEKDGKLDEKKLEITKSQYRSLTITDSKFQPFEAMKLCGDAANVIDQGANAEVMDLVEAAAEAVEDIDFDTKGAALAFAAWGATLKFSKLRPAPSGTVDKPDPAYAYFIGNELPGKQGYVIKVKMSPKDSTKVIRVAVSKIFIGGMYKKDDYSVEALLPAQIEVLADYVAEITDSLVSGDKAVSNAKKVTKRLLTASEKMIDNAEKAKLDKTATSELKTITASVQKFLTVAHQPIQVETRIIMETCKNGYGFGTRCLSNIVSD